MQSTRPATHVIACPHCGARWRLPAGLMGDAGQQVDCPRCGEAFLAAPPELHQSPLSARDEDALDRELVAHEERVSRHPVSEAVRALATGRAHPSRSAAAAEPSAVQPMPVAEAPRRATARIIFILALAAAGIGLLWVGTRLVAPQPATIIQYTSTTTETD